MKLSLETLTTKLKFKHSGCIMTCWKSLQNQRQLNKPTEDKIPIQVVLDLRPVI